jgi:hypothetical protein
LNEIYRLADKYSDNEQKYYSIIRKAYLLYPNDSYINLTMAYLSLKKGEADEAAEYLSKVNQCPQKTMNEGLVAYLQGDLNKAIQLVEQARAQGVAEATRQLEEFKKSESPMVLISPSMNEGVDLPGDLCRFQIIYKLPYPDLADKQIRLRANADEDWYNYKTSLALIQAYGRGMRHEDDYCTTYLIDSRKRQFVKKDRFMPDEFRALCQT